jgi:hypothetical protein
MRLLCCAILIVGWLAMALVQHGSSQTQAPGYQPAVPIAPTVNSYGGGWGGSGGTTAAGSAMQVMGSVISAAGNYNLSTSAAAVNMTVAQKNEIENRQQATDAYFSMRATNRAAREAEAGPKPTAEQMVRIARDGVPKPPQTSEMDPVSGKLSWPGVLQMGSFEAPRGEVDQLFAKRAVHGGLDYADQSKVREAIDAMFIELKGQIRNVPPQDYVASRGFLQSLMYAATKSDLQ